jgi:LPS-assembly lipoprotein
LSERVARRGLLCGAAALLALGGCGFRPLYGEGGAMAPSDPAIQSELASVTVGLIPERFGQLLRRDLQTKLGNRGAAGARWELLVGPSFQTDSIGIQQDGSATRVRYIATANWTLLRMTPREPVANGFERTIDSFNVQPNQFFASDMANDATQRRLSQQLAEEIVTRLALRFRSLEAGQPTRLIEPVEPPPTLAIQPVPPAFGAPPTSPGLGGGLQGGIGSATGR